MFTKHYKVWIKHIHSNNGFFMMKAFKDHVTASNQQPFCGVSMHQQNGVIEWYISFITTHTYYTMLLHTRMQIWPNMISSEFWSFAFMHAVIYTTAPHGQKKRNHHSLCSQMRTLHTPQMISKCLGLWCMFSTLLCKQAHLVLVNGWNALSRVHTLVIHCTMQAM